MNVQVASQQSIEIASAARREWRYASWTVRLSVLCLVIFYLFALASPFFAPYDPTFQNRTIPDCPPMRLHIAPPSDWSQGLLYTHPVAMADRVERRYAADPSRRVYI